MSIQLCDKCGKYEANKNSKWCQKCLDQADKKSELTAQMKALQVGTIQTMDRVSSFMNQPLNSNILTFPYIGPGVAESLASAGIKDTYQLIGKFMMMSMDKKLFEQWLSQFSLIKNRDKMVDILDKKVRLAFGI